MLMWMIVACLEMRKKEWIVVRSIILQDKKSIDSQIKLKEGWQKLWDTFLSYLGLNGCLGLQKWLKT